MDIPALQQAIDSIDDELISLLQRRFVFSRQIGALKKQTGQLSIDEQRVISQRTRFVRRCIESGLDPTMSQQLVLVITEQVITERLGGSTRPT
ncbi:chorismate mutase [Bradyrhizobium prioriisuperbiae]|uniref:chorismate mutase n=1 Tax=Bradyrhizobium prioriisuperbiae TaxID=2854389 RepID=UPI0028ED6A25|nr:chorismate mutase [Bradyrhizobium prioritasuperba]